MSRSPAALDNRVVVQSNDGIGGRIDSFDRQVARQVRIRRISVGLSQNELAKTLGVTCQQVHKYETGRDRISAERLFRIAEALQTPIDFFYEGLGDPEPRAPSERERRAIEIARDFRRIENEDFQYALTHLARALASGVELSDTLGPTSPVRRS